MVEYKSSPSPMSLEKHEDDAADSSQQLPFDALLAQLQSTLQDGGPDVDEGVIMAYVARALPNDQRAIVRDIIFTRRRWFEVWAELVAIDAEIEQRDRRQNTLSDNRDHPSCENGGTDN